jgi:hypothetical protein
MNDIHDEELIHRLQQLGEITPAPAATGHALERVRQALAHSPPGPPRQRRIMVRRMAAAAVVALTGSLFIWWVRAPAPARASFADVEAALHTSRSVTCRQVIRIKAKPDNTIRLWILDNGLCRAEMSDNTYSVTDPGAHRALFVNPQKREATLWQGMNTPQINLYERLKNLPRNASARDLPGKKIDGKDALGFAVKVFGQEMTVWADAATRLPVRIEAQDKDEDGNPAEFVADNFVFDKELDAKLFALEPPAGYKLVTMGIAVLPDAPADPQLKDLIVTPLVGIGTVRFSMGQADVEKMLGKPDAVHKVGKNGYLDLNYGSRGFFIGVSKTLGVVTISCVAQEVMVARVRAFNGKTDKGIVLGASTADIIRAYGAPDSKESNQGSTYLSYNQLQANFTLFDDKLVQFQFSRPRPAP